MHDAVRVALDQHPERLEGGRRPVPSRPLEVERLVLGHVHELVHQRDPQPDGHLGTSDDDPLRDGVVQRQGARVGQLAGCLRQVEVVRHEAQGCEGGDRLVQQVLFGTAKVAGVDPHRAAYSSAVRKSIGTGCSKVSSRSSSTKATRSTT